MHGTQANEDDAASGNHVVLIGIATDTLWLQCYLYVKAQALSIPFPCKISELLLPNQFHAIHLASMLCRCKEEW